LTRAFERCYEQQEAQQVTIHDSGVESLAKFVKLKGQKTTKIKTLCALKLWHLLVTFYGSVAVVNAVGTDEVDLRPLEEH
jgi:hypothetical protein